MHVLHEVGRIKTCFRDTRWHRQRLPRDKARPSRSFSTYIHTSWKCHLQRSRTPVACVLCNSVAPRTGSHELQHVARVSGQVGRTGRANYNANRRIIKQVTCTRTCIAGPCINKHLRSLPVAGNIVQTCLIACSR